MSDINKKPENIASAVYLITSFFNDQEPLKWKLRALASELVPLALSIGETIFREREAVISETKNTAMKIAGLFSVAKNVGLISSDNHDLMQTEISRYVESLGKPTDISELINSNYPVLKAPEIRENTVGKGLIEIKDKTNFSTEEKFTQPVIKKDKSLKEFGAVSVKKNNRQSIIISILKRKKEIMIKDVTPLINGCSEKTIQRELSEMVRSGVLKKSGEKRWSRYSLPS